MPFRFKSKLLISASICTLLAACGGGSSTEPVVNTPDIPQNPTTDPATFKTDEYSRNWALEAVNAANAYASGYTGAGVKIGIVDFNFLLDSTEVNYSADSRGRETRWVNMYEAQIGDTASTTPHGHSVAVVAAALKNDDGTHGLAFDAEVVAVDYFSGVLMTTEERGGVTYYQSNPYRYAINQGARIVNKSLGYDEDDVISNPPVVSERYQNLSDAYVVLDGGLLVSSAGNNSDPEPSQSNLDTIQILRDNNLLDGPGAFIIVGAVDENNEIASFSDRAGTGDSQNFFMVAPGVNITSYWDTETDGPGLYNLNGTSFSAPLVSAAAALIMQRWPNLTAREVRQILFDTATDLGTTGIDEVYGHGLLNVDNALKAQGNVKIASPTASGMAVQGANIVIPAAFGDMGGQIVGAGNILSNVTVFDKYGRDFQIDMSGGFKFATNRSQLSGYMQAQNTWHSYTLPLGMGQKGLSYSFSRDLSPMADLERRGFFGQKVQSESYQTQVVMEMTVPFNIAQGFTFMGAQDGLPEPDQIRIGFGQSLFSVMDQPTPDVSKDFKTGVSAIDRSFAESLLQDDMGYARGVYAVYEKARSDSGVRWRLGFSYSNHRPQTTGYSLYGSLSSTDQIADDEFYGLQNTDLQDPSVSAAILSRDWLGQSSTGYLQLAVVSEQGSFLGAASSGSLSLSDDTRSVIMRAGWHKNLSDQSGITVNSLFGYSNLNAGSETIFDQLDSVLTSSWQASLYQHAIFSPQDTLSLTVSQPLRVERADATITVGQGVNWDLNGQVNYTAQRMNLVPSGREIALQLAYGFNTNGFKGEAAVVYRRDLHHQAGVDDPAAFFMISKAF